MVIKCMGYVLVIFLFLVATYVALSAAPEWRYLRRNGSWWSAFLVSSFAIANFGLLFMRLIFLDEKISENRTLVMLGVSGSVFLIYAVYLWRHFRKSRT